MRLLIKASGKQGLTEEDFAEMLSVLPAQNANDEALIKRGIQEGPAFVAADRSAGWLIFNCESQDKAQELLQTAPVYKYCDYDITPLLATEENTPG